MFSICISHNQFIDMLPRPPFIHNSQVGISISGYPPRRGITPEDTHGVTPGQFNSSSNRFLRPYAFRDDSVNRLSDAIETTYGVILDGNILMRTLPASDKYSDWGYGPCLGQDGWMDPPVTEDVMRPWLAMGVPSNVVGLIVTDNYITNAGIGLSFDSMPVSTNMPTDFSISGNTFYDFGVAGISFQQAAGTRMAGRIADNVFDGDPYHSSARRRPAGQWNPGGTPIAIRHADNQGFIVSGNRFRNVSQLLTNAIGYEAIDNILECEPFAVGYHSQNGGIGAIPSSGRGWLYQIVASDPTKRDFGMLKNPCALETSSCPTSGTFVTGHFVKSTDPAGTGAFGWVRVTTGRNHVIGTDWKTVPLL